MGKSTDVRMDDVTVQWGYGVVEGLYLLCVCVCGGGVVLYDSC